MDGLRPVCISFGESGWDIISGTQFPGGLSISLPYHLTKLGITAIPITRIGIDESGKNLIRFMEQAGVSTDHFQLDYELMTGKMIKTALHGVLLHDYPRSAAWDKIVWDTAYERLLSADSFLIYGSLAARDVLSRDTLFEMMEVAPKRVLLLALRSPYYTKQIVEHCIRGAHIVQLTVDELELVTGWFANFSTVEDRIRILQDRFELPYLIVTEGTGRALASDRGTIYYHNRFAAQTNEDTGCADAFLAGLLSRLIAGEPLMAALEHGCALGRIVGSLPGACPQYDTASIAQLIAKNDFIS